MRIHVPDIYTHTSYYYIVILINSILINSMRNFPKSPDFFLIHNLSLFNVGDLF